MAGLASAGDEPLDRVSLFLLIWIGLALGTLGWFAIRPALRESTREWNAPIAERVAGELPPEARLPPCPECNDTLQAEERTLSLRCPTCGWRPAPPAG